METPQQLASHSLVSAEEHAAAATALRGLASGIDTSVQQNELTEAEREVLTRASALLEALAARRGKAAAIREKETAKLQALEKEVHEAMRGNFADLATDADKVAFIGAIEPYRAGLSKPADALRQPSDVAFLLDQAFRECLVSATYTLAGLALKHGKTAEQVVQEAWAEHQTERTRLVARFAPVLDRIAVLRQGAVGA